MTAPRDKFGRPIVVVTGMGIVTSLGAGKTDNWEKLTAGESGIRTVTRFPIDGLKTTMAGTVDFVSVDPIRQPASPNGWPTSPPKKPSSNRNRPQGRFSGPLFLAVAPVEVEWPQRLDSDAPSVRPDFDYTDLLRVGGGGKFAPVSSSLHVRLGGRPSCRDLRHQGIADFAFDRLRVRRHRHSARPRSHPPRRNRRRAVHRHRWLGQSRKPWCGSPCCRRCRPRTIRRRRRQAFSKNRDGS